MGNNNLRWNLPSAVAVDNFRRLAELWGEHRADLEATVGEALFEDADKHCLFDERIPSERGRAEIGMSRPVLEQIRLWPEALHYFGLGCGCIPFTASFHANLHYQAIEKEFLDLPLERVNEAIVGNRGGGRLDVTEGAMINMRGLAMLHFFGGDSLNKLEDARFLDKDLLTVAGVADPSIGAVESITLARFREPIGPVDTAGEAQEDE